MAASYPSSVKSFTAVTDGDTVTDEMFEEAYDEVTAVETALLTGGLAHDLDPDATANTRDLGSSAKRWRDGYVTGLNFPATQVPSADANTLDDYEEGTWTPVLGGSGGVSGQSYTTQVGHYVKVGKLVTCWGHIVLSNKGTITGSLRITGLPAAAASGLYPGMLTIGNFSALATSVVWLGGIMNASSQFVELLILTAAGTGTTTPTTTDVSNTTTLVFSITYEAAA